VNVFWLAVIILAVLALGIIIGRWLPPPQHRQYNALHRLRALGLVDDALSRVDPADHPSDTQDR